MKLTKRQLKQIIKEEIKFALNEIDYAKLSLVKKVVYAAADQDADKFENLLRELGHEDLKPNFVNDQIMQIKTILDDQSAYSPFNSATKYVKQLVGME
jgi:hypothetical protein